MSLPRGTSLTAVNQLVALTTEVGGRTAAVDSRSRALF